MRKIVGTLLGKSVATSVRALKKGGGQAMPGKIVERFVPGYLAVMLGQIPEAIVLVTGTNGKTTTTKMIVELLMASGKRVLTNATGSNLTRGIISSISEQASWRGRLDFDMAVFELDEAWAQQFTDVIQPDFVIGLNASRDQLDRFGEVETVASLIGETMLAATKGIIVNADDRLLSAVVKKSSGASVHYFGVAEKLLKYFPRDEELHQASVRESKASGEQLDVELASFSGTEATYHISDKDYKVKLQVTGQHNFQNAAAVLAAAQLLLPDTPLEKLLEWLASVKPAFGRGQIYRLRDGSKLQVALVKNPASFRQGLASYLAPGKKVLIAINDKIADSRDVSWLWDVDFSTLAGFDITISGSRAADMTLRLSYDEIEVEHTEPNLSAAVKDFSEKPGDKIIFATYTAMLSLHKLLSVRGKKP